MKKTIFLAAGLSSLLLLASCTRPGAGQTGSGAAVTASQERITVEKGTIENRIIATGKVAPRTTTSLSFQRSGKVSEVLVKEGQAVKKGGLLARLNTKDFEITANQQWAAYLSAQAAYSDTIRGPSAAKLKSAQAALNSARAAYSELYKSPEQTSVAQLKASLDSAEASLRSAQAAYDRAFGRAGGGKGIDSSVEKLNLDKAQNAYAAAKAKYDAAFAQPAAGSVASASSQIQTAQANIAALYPVSETIAQRQAAMQQAYLAWQQADATTQKAVIAAPFDGLVTKLNVDAGEWANSGATVVELVDFTVPEFEVDVDEADLGNVKIGQDARVQLQTYPDTPIPAKVESISTVGTNTGTIITYKVRLALNQNATDAAKALSILINMSGTSEVVTAKASDVAVVPARALVYDAEAKSYSVLKLNAAGGSDTVPVKLGFRDSTRVQITDGLSVGDTLLLPTQKVKSANGGGGGNGGG